jgi:hypothetical protein
MLSIDSNLAVFAVHTMDRLDMDSAFAFDGDFRTHGKFVIRP